MTTTELTRKDFVSDQEVRVGAPVAVIMPSSRRC